MKTAICFSLYDNSAWNIALWLVWCLMPLAVGLLWFWTFYDSVVGLNDAFHIQVARDNEYIYISICVLLLDNWLFWVIEVIYKSFEWICIAVLLWLFVWCAYDVLKRWDWCLGCSGSWVITFNSFSAKHNNSRGHLNHYNDSRLKLLMKIPFQQVPACLI